MSDHSHGPPPKKRSWLEILLKVAAAFIAVGFVLNFIGVDVSGKIYNLPERVDPKSLWTDLVQWFKSLSPHHP